MSATGQQNITTSDTTVYSPPLKRLYVGVAGDVSLVDVYGNTSLLKALPQNWYSFANTPISKVKATGTTATNIVGDTNANP